MSQLIFLDSVVKVPMVALPVRSVFVEAGNGGVLISPGSKLEEAQLRSLKKVSDIVAPNLLHSAGLPKAKQIHKDAKLWVPKDSENVLKEKFQALELNSKNWPYQDELALVNIMGMPKVNESVFIHNASKSLIVTDLGFNMQDVKGLAARLIFSLFGTYQEFGVSKFFLRGVKDKAAFEKSLAEMFSYDFENIIVSHGENVQGNAKQIFLAALAKRDLRPS